MRKQLLAVLFALAVVAAALLPLFAGGPPPAAVHAEPAAAPAGSVSPAAGPTQQVPVAPTSATPADVAQNRVDADTPPQYRAPYLPGRTPVETQADGTQVYEDIPYKVRQPDGTMKEFRCRMVISPTKAVSIFPMELESDQGR